MLLQVTCNRLTVISVLSPTEINMESIDLAVTTENVAQASLTTSSTFNWSTVLYSLALFLVAGICEIGGGYLVWKGVKEEGNRELYICIGAIVLIIYGFVPTLQPSNVFGRVYAVYGGFFIVLSYCWSVVFDNFKLDKGDYIGGGIALAGVCVAWFWPR